MTSLPLWSFALVLAVVAPIAAKALAQAFERSARTKGRARLSLR